MKLIVKAYRYSSKTQQLNKSYSSYQVVIVMSTEIVSVMLWVQMGALDEGSTLWKTLEYIETAIKQERNG